MSSEELYLLRRAYAAKSCIGKGEIAVVSLFSTSRSAFVGLFNISESAFLRTKCIFDQTFYLIFFPTVNVCELRSKRKQKHIWAPYSLASFPIRIPLQWFHKCYYNCPLSYSAGQA